MIKDERIKEFIINKLKEIAITGYKTTKLSDDDLSYIGSCMKDYFEGSGYDKSDERVRYDFWFELFEEEELLPFLRSL